MTRLSLDTQKTHLAYLPTSNLSELKYLKFPHPRTNVLTDYILHSDQLYEVRIVDNDNPHDSQNHLRDTTKGDDLVLRSVIFTNDNLPKSDGNENTGFILEDGAVYLTTKFNFSYTLINILTPQLMKAESSNQRYLSLEDLTETLISLLPNDDINHLPEPLLTSAFSQITETIQEGDETYYRHSTQAILIYLRSRMECIKEKFPQTIMNNLILPKYNPSDISANIPENILDLIKIKYSIFLLSSYLNPHWTKRLKESYDFKELQTYIDQIEEEKKLKILAEEQIRNMSLMNNNNNKKPIVAKATAVKKKTSAPIGKGPLDSFFAKKKK